MLYFTAALVFVGLIVCVSGRTLFATTPFLGGFLISGMLGYQLGLTFINPPNSWPDFVLPRPGCRSIEREEGRIP